MGKILKSLETYYQDKGICSTDFRCRHSRTCNLPTKATAAFVGTGYEDSTLPRLLTLSPAPGTASPDKITAEGRKNYCQNVSRAALRSVKNWHWLSTIELERILLERFQPDMTWEDPRSCFAHVNCVKCSTDKRETKSISFSIFNNCFEYIDGETAILEPDIVVTQGRKARETIEKLILHKVIELSSGTQQFPVSQYELIRLNNRNVHWFYYLMIPGGRFADKVRPCFENWAQYIRSTFLVIGRMSGGSPPVLPERLKR